MVIETNEITCMHKNSELGISKLLQLNIFTMCWTVLNDPCNDYYWNKYKLVIG